MVKISFIWAVLLASPLACDKPVPLQGVYLNTYSIVLLAAYIKTRSKYLFRQRFNPN